MATDEVINVCFHGVGAPARVLEPGEAPYWVRHEDFLRILDSLADWADPVAVSFDDGNASDIELALPALRERGLPATFFVLAGRLDQGGSLSTTDIAELVRAGMSVGTHGMHHTSWRRMDVATSRRELAEAREIISAAAGSQVTEAACPFGAYDRGALASLRSAGYTRVHTSDRGVARRESWLQPRFSVVAGDTPATLEAQVRAARRNVARATRAAKGLVKRWR